MKLLHIDSSALGTHSASRELTGAIVDAWKRREPGLEVTCRDLAARPLPHWAPVADSSDPAARAGTEVLEEFLAADVVVIGAPMYNFSVPSSLKAWIDRILVAGRTFRYTAQGPEGLAGGRRVIVASTRGGFYGADSGREDFDFQEKYLRRVFGFIGITDVEFVRAEGLNISPEQKAKALQDAHAMIEERLLEAA
jgi:FMN-dependent NADH-azoreductase